METTKASASTSNQPGKDPDTGDVHSDHAQRDRAEQLIAVAERCGRALGHAGRAIRSPRGMTTVSVGILVAVAGWFGERGSAWGVPMLLVGALLIAIGLIGSRLSGSFGVRWGEDGAYLELSGVIAPPGERRPAPKIPSTAADGELPTELPARLVPPTEVEGSAETIEFNVEAIREAPISSA